MEYKINENFLIRLYDKVNWVVVNVRRGILTKDFGGKKVGDSFENEHIIGYCGTLEDAWRMIIRRFPNYVKDKTELNQTIQDIKNLQKNIGNPQEFFNEKVK